MKKLLITIGLILAIQTNAAVFIVPQGGTGSSSYKLNSILKGNGSSQILKSGLFIDSSNNLTGVANLNGISFTASASDWNTVKHNYAGLTSFSNSVTGLTYNSSTGATSLTSGYVIPTTASTSDWNTTKHSYVTLGSFSSSATGLTYTSGTGAFSLTAGYVIPLTASTSDWNTVKHSYISGNQTITLSGDVTGSGATAITTVVKDSVGLAGNPTAATQAASDNSTRIATTAYVTAAVTASNPAVAVQAATTQASDTSSLTYNNGVSGIGATLTGANNTALAIDGYTFTALGQRLLVKNDTVSPSGSHNGVYYVTQIQTAILPPILTRALDYDMSSDINNTGTVPVINGTANADTSWLLTSAVTTVGTDPISYIQFTYALANTAQIAANSFTGLQVFTIGASSSTNFEVTGYASASKAFFGGGSQIQFSSNKASLSIGFEDTVFASASKYYGATLSSCTSNNALQWSSGLFSCSSNTFQPTITTGTTAQYFRGDLSLATLNQAAIAGLTTADRPTFTGLTLSAALSGSGASFSSLVEFNKAASISSFLNVGSFTRLGNSIAQFASSSPTFLQVNLQNLSSNASASTDYVATSNDGTQSSRYVNLGINSSNFKWTNQQSLTGPHDAYLYASVSNLVIAVASSSPSAAINFSVGASINTTNRVLSLLSGGASFSVPLWIQSTGATDSIASISGRSLTSGNGIKITVPSANFTGKSILIQNNLLASQFYIDNQNRFNLGTSTQTSGTFFQLASATLQFDAISTGANASASIRLLANNSNTDNKWSVLAGGLSGTDYDRFEILNNGVALWKISSNSHVIYSANTIPTVGTCATSPLMGRSSTDTLGSIKIGTSPGNTCAVNFGKPYAKPPLCQVQGTGGVGAVTVVAASASTTVLTFRGSATFIAGASYSWNCYGYGY